jgi:hypothetical protein
MGSARFPVSRPPVLCGEELFEAEKLEGRLVGEACLVEEHPTKTSRHSRHRASDRVAIFVFLYTPDYQLWQGMWHTLLYHLVSTPPSMENFQNFQ